MSKKDRLITYGKRIFLILALIFVVRYFYLNIENYKEIDIQINWLVFGIAVILYYIYKFMLAAMWHYLTKINQCAIKFKNAVVAYFKSILGKYIPGKVFMLLARMPAYEEKGVSLAKVSVCFFLENICTLLAAAFLFLISLFFFPNDLLKEYIWAVILLVILFFIFIHPKIINYVLGLCEKIFKKKNLKIPIKYSEMLKVVGMFIFNWMFLGGGMYAIAYSMYPISGEKFLYICGIYGLSRIIGIIAVFAPSGIGVSEGILVLGLSLIMPEEYAVIISIVSRLWVTISELSMVGIAYIYDFLKKQ